MTAITIHTHRPQGRALWVTAFAAALLAAGLILGLVLAFAGDASSSGGSTTPPSTTTIEQTTGGASNPVAPAQRCPGSVKDWTC
jgi:hypothetical protein